MNEWISQTEDLDLNLACVILDQEKSLSENSLNFLTSAAASTKERQ